MRRTHFGLAVLSMPLLMGSSSPPSGAPQVGIVSPLDNATLWGRVFVTGTMIDPSTNGRIDSVAVTVEVKTGTFTTTKTTKTFSRCSTDAFALDCANPGATDTDDNQLSLDAAGDFTYSRKLLANIVKVTVKATDNSGASGTDSVPVKYDACAVQTNPSYGSQTYANNTWVGDFKACGQNVGTYFLTHDFNGNPVTINTITGSLILVNTIVSHLGDAAPLQTVQKDLVIRGHNYLTTLSGSGGPGLENAKITQRVILHGNHKLTDVSALLSDVPVSASVPTTIEITDNPLLPTCNAKQVVAQLRAGGWTGDALIAGNQDPGAICP